MDKGMHSAEPHQHRQPQRKRVGKRMLLACVNCKSRKLRCDDQVPACMNCERFGLVCLVEDPATKRQQPRNYLETLEQRVAELEIKLQQERSKSHQDSSRFTEADFQERGYSQGVFGADWSSNSDHVGSTDTTRVETDGDDMNDIATRVGLLSVAAGAEPHYLGSSSAITLCRIINSALVQALPKRGRQNSARHSNDSHSASSPFMFPNSENCIRLSDAYFDQIHTQYPFLHEPTFRSWEASFLPSEMSSMSGLGSFPSFALYMVYAIGALMLPELSHLAEHLCNAAQVYVPDIVQADNLETIQAYLLFAVYSIRSPVGLSVWKCSGLALRQCIELGYHRRQVVTRSQMDPLRHELQKRAFWCARSLDCLAATILGRPLGLQNHEIDCEYPIDVEDAYISHLGILVAPRTGQEPPTRITKGIETFRIRHLWGKIYSSLYSNISESSPTHPTYQIRTDELRQELEAWKASVPPASSAQKDVMSFFTSDYWYEFCYNYTILYLYRGHLVNLGSGVSESIAMELFNAAGTLCYDVRNRLLSRRTTYTWGALHTIFVSGLTYLHCLWSSTAVREASRYDLVSRTCTNCTVMLVLIAQWNDDAEPYRDMFEALATRTLTMLTESGNKEFAQYAVGEPFQLEDMSQWAASLFEGGMGSGSDQLLSELMNMIS